MQSRAELSFIYAIILYTIVMRKEGKTEEEIKAFIEEQCRVWM